MMDNRDLAAAETSTSGKHDRRVDVFFERGLLGRRLPEFLSKLLARTFYAYQRRLNAPIFIACNPSTRVVDSYNLTTYWIMVFDEERMSCYRDSIPNMARGKTVLDLGTGATMPLARLALEGGARHVYAIEGNSESAQEARALAAKISADDRVTIIEGMSTDTELPETVDLIIHEIIGTVASSEGAPAFVKDLNDRALSTSGHVLPNSFSTCVAAVDVSKQPSKLAQFGSFILGGSGRFRERRGLQVVCNPPANVFLSRAGSKIEEWRFDRQSEVENWSLSATTSVFVPIERTGLFVGFLMWPEATFPGTNRLLDGQKVTNWGMLFVRLFERPVEVQAGREIKVRLDVDASGSDPVYTLRAELPDGQVAHMSWRGAGHLSEVLE